VDGIGERLKEERLRNGWSQKDLAQESKTNVDTISGIETGQHEPRPSTLRKLAKALNVEVRDLFEEPALSGKAEAPSPGPLSVLDLVLDAAQRQATADRQAIARLGSSGQPQASTVRYENDALRSLLEHPHGDVAETLVDLARRHVQVEQENVQLREQIAALQEERQRAYQGSNS
jgi:transcriptional regulator with XRE-family HTH domain